MERQEILNKIVTTYGTKPQLHMAVEECSELIKAIMKYERKISQDFDIPAITENARLVSEIVDEIADVQIMTEQLKIIFNCTNEVNERVDFKLNRQLERMKKQTITEE